jgi:hypothetical protein
MTAIVRVCAIAGALVVAGCASWTPNLDFLPSLPSLSGGAAVSLVIETDPPGADARTSVGPGCRTPCTVAVSAEREFTVSLTLNGYLPQTVLVRPRAPDTVRMEPDSVAPTVDLVPNPILVQMEPAPPPAPVKKRRAPPRTKAKAPQK